MKPNITTMNYDANGIFELRALQVMNFREEQEKGDLRFNFIDTELRKVLPKDLFFNVDNDIKLWEYLTQDFEFV